MPTQPHHPEAMNAQPPHGQSEQGQAHGMSQRPFWQKVWVGVTHCGAGCTLGDIIAEWAIFFLAVTIAGTEYWPNIALDYTLAFTLGIVFQ